MLDLLGVTVSDLPYGISELIHLECLDLPNVKNIQGADSRKIKNPQEELNWHDWGISILSSEIVEDSKLFPIPVSSAKFLANLEKDRSLWKSSFKQFHFSIRPIKEQKRGLVPYYGDDVIFRDIYLKPREFHDFEEQRLLEI
ncbi:hypothetical protein Acr_09g0001240 [Actinidia rufa]|uniref:Uncharacterized protein n=1 Tax=Actinidia rufa TaxID=165716 RepID=A0A7J0F4Q7_9ERIC|nr:hypothetical protein Acr_09g0001240 [Actinidia rufa]